MGDIHQPYKPPLTHRKVQTAIDDACQYLRRCQLANGTWPEGAGGTCMATLALLAAGADPASDEAVQKALNWLLKLDVDNTYVRAVRANVWEYALRKVPYESRYREALKVDYEWLLKALGNKEGWRYTMSSSDWDNSVTQYGVLGIWAAARAGFDPGEAFWKKMSNHFRNCQTKDGGWVYTGGGPNRNGGTPNMATAGLASMFLVFDMHHGKTSYSAAQPNVFAGGDAAACLDAIRRGMKWLGAHHGGAWRDGYFLYGIERTGVASGRKYIGGVDWFKQGAQSLLPLQQTNGSFSIQGHGGQIVRNSFAILFLVYGGAPVAYNKLEYGDDRQWNLNPRDLANLSKYLWSAYERPLNWHSVNIAADADEFEAPVLFISGGKAVDFSDAEVARLREYIQRGGTILAEPSDRNAAFAKSMETLLWRMFPAAEYPGYGLEKLPAEHGVYTVLKQEWKERPALRGVSNGARTFFFLSDAYLSGEWQMNDTKSDAFKLGMNLLFYATDLGGMDGKFATGLPDTPTAPARKTALTIARINPAGAKGDPVWSSAPLCWKQFASYLTHVCGTKVEERPVVELGVSDLSGLRMLHLTGREAFTLTEAERKALKAFVEKGGTVLVDAVAGSRAFAESARREIQAAVGELVPLDPSSLLATGTFEGGSDLTRGLRLKLAARKFLREKGEEGKWSLFVHAVGRRPAVLFSEFDLTGAMADVRNYRALAWKPASARRIVGNLAALVTAE